MWKRFTSLALLWAILPVAVFAQSQATTGVISGRVVDQDSQPVTGATVELINTSTNYLKTLKSDEQGRFHGLLLPLGPYRIRASKEGHYIAQQEGLPVTVGKTLVVEIRLEKIKDQSVLDLLSQLDNLEDEAQRQTIIEEVTVTAADYKKVVEIGRIESSTQIDEDAVQGLPNNGRNFLDYSFLTPGVTIVQGPDGEEMSINGQKGINNNISVDGADFNNPFFGEQRGGQRPAFTFNLDAVQEVVVVADGAPAEFGRSSGGFVNVITKSGTNEIQGSAHIFHKNESLNARAENPDGSKADDFDFDQTQIGFTLGGPIVKDKAFYFVSFDYQQGESVKQTNPARIEQDVLDYFDGIGITGESGPITRTDDAHAFLGKIDWHLGPDHLATFRFTNTFSEQENGTFDVDSWGASANAVEKADSRAFSAALNSVLSGSLINELRVQWSREDRPRPYNGPTIAGTNRPLPDTAFDFGSQYRFGMPFFIPVSYHDTRLQINDNLSIISGNHLIKVGAELNITRAAQTFLGFANGRWIFSSTQGFLNYTQDPNYVECSDGSSNFEGVCPPGTDIVGPVLLYLQQAGVGNISVEEAGTQTIDTEEVAVFVQDKWDVSPTLTVQYGLRWEAQYQPDPITPVDEVFYAPFIGTSSMGQLFPSDGTIPSDDEMFQPRLGITWDPKGNGKSVVRATAGIYYARIPGLALASSRSTNGSRGQTLFRSSAASPFLGPPPAYPDLISQDAVGSPFRPDVFVFHQDFENPKTTNFSVTFEQELMANLAGYLKFSYNKGENQTRFVNYNDPLLGNGVEGPWTTGLGEDGGNGLGTLTVVESGGESLYRGYTVGFNKLMSDGWSWQFNYTYSKDKSHDDNERDPFSLRYARVTDLDKEWSWSDRDQRHRLSTYALYNTHGWNFNLRFSYRSAQPKSITETGADAQTSSDRINADGTITPRNLGRKNNQFSSIDLRISKAFAVAGLDLEAVLDGFNLANSKNLLSPEVTNLVFNFDGTVQSGSGNPRQFQLGLKGRW